MWRELIGTAHDLVGLFLPLRCSGCDRPLMPTEKALCLFCVDDLPRNRYHDDPDNRVEQVFRGRVHLSAASAFLRFDRGGRVQRMLHRLKYRNDTAVGLQLGALMGEELRHSMRFASVDTVMAVPLHPRKESQRGYNQSAVVVQGLLTTWPIAHGSSGLLRQVRTSSQTRKGRLERWTNVRNAFDLAEGGLPEGRHVLLVDDVVTTGATLEACIRALQRVPGTRVSVCTVACA